VNGVAWTMNAALAIAVVALVISKWSVFMMARQINQRVDPVSRISLKWWPNYKDRRVIKVYRSVLPQGRLNIVYASCIGSAGIILFLAVFLASRTQH
jgi:hypothetical protein